MNCLLDNPITRTCQKSVQTSPTVMKMSTKSTFNAKKVMSPNDTVLFLKIWEMTEGRLESIRSWFCTAASITMYEIKSKQECNGYHYRADFNRILNAFQYRLTLTISIMITINIIKPNRAIFSYRAWKATGSGTKISFEVSLGFTHILMPLTSPHKEFRFLLIIYREFESSSRRYYLC